MNHRLMILGGAAVLAGVTVANAQTAARTPAPPNPQPPAGRYQLVMQPSTSTVLGRVYLLDTATGRVWADIQITPSDKAVEDFLKNVSDASLRNDLRQTFIDRYSPCNKMPRCFVEIEKATLNANGEWISQVQPAQGQIVSVVIPIYSPLNGSAFATNTIARSSGVNAAACRS